MSTLISKLFDLFKKEQKSRKPIPMENLGESSDKKVTRENKALDDFSNNDLNREKISQRIDTLTQLIENGDKNNEVISLLNSLVLLLETEKHSFKEKTPLFFRRTYELEKNFFYLEGNINKFGEYLSEAKKSTFETNEYVRPKNR